MFDYHNFYYVLLPSGAMVHIDAPVAVDAERAAVAYARRYNGRVVGGPFPTTRSFAPVKKVVVGADSAPNDGNHQAHRQANYQSALHGRDTETVLDPRERGTGSLDTPSLLPPREAIDEWANSSMARLASALAPAATKP